MSFSRANPLGWALYEVLTSAQMNALDIDHANAIDGAAGGTYSPTGAVIFGAGKLQSEPEAGDAEFQELYTDHAEDDDTRIFSLAGAVPQVEFSFNSNGYLSQDACSSSSCFTLWFSPRPAHGVLKEVHLYVISYASHGANYPPQHMPKLQLHRLGLLDPTPVLVAEVDDASATVGDYEDWHPVSLTGLSENVSPQWASATYRLRLYGEWGTYALAGLTATHFATVTSVTRGYPG